MGGLLYTIVFKLLFLYNYIGHTYIVKTIIQHLFKTNIGIYVWTYKPLSSSMTVGTHICQITVMYHVNFSLMSPITLHDQATWGTLSC